MPTQKEKPIIFSSEMIRAILENRKPQTRRVIGLLPNREEWIRLPNLEMQVTADGILQSRCPPENMIWRYIFWGNDRGPKSRHDKFIKCPYGTVGDRLWVKEWLCESDNKILYGFDEAFATKTGKFIKWRWKSDSLSPIFMPKEFARFWLEITDIRVENLQEITGDDAIKEGWPRDRELFPTINTTSKAKNWFEQFWDSLNAKRGYGWETNPWVWVINFKRISKDGQ